MPRRAILRRRRVRSRKAGAARGFLVIHRFKERRAAPSGLARRPNASRFHLRPLQKLDATVALCYYWL
jgi:hypothetical protein